MIAVTERTPPVAAPPKACLAGVQQASSPPRRTPLRSRATSPSQPSSPTRSHTSSPTLVRNSSIGSTGTHSPVMRSMFPRFDPNVPLSQQKYYPNMDRVPRAPVWTDDSFTRPEYSPSLYSQPGSPEAVSSRGKSKPAASLLTSPNDVSTDLQKQPTPSLSTPEELVDIWSIANGQASESGQDNYTLGLRW